MNLPERVRQPITPALDMSGAWVLKYDRGKAGAAVHILFVEESTSTDDSVQS